MRVSKEQCAKHRERILDAAAKCFRERGFDGIGLADLMQSAGLTHGGFYGHFNSKEDLIAQTCARCLCESTQKSIDLVKAGGKNPIAAIAKGYLHTAHRDAPGEGCVVAALAADVSRQSPPVRRAFTDGVRSLVDVLVGAIRGKSKAARREQALAIWASLVGGMVLARAVDDPDFSDEILKAVSRSVTKMGQGDSAKSTR